MTRARAEIAHKPQAAPRAQAGATQHAPTPAPDTAAAAAHESADFAAVPDDQLFRLQSLAGNAAVAGVVQREPAARDAHEGRRAHGADVRAALQQQLPGLLAALTPEQVSAWQEYLDWQADQALERKQEAELNQRPEYTGYSATEYRDQAPGYQSKLRRIQSSAQKQPAASGTTVDVRSLLSDGILDAPAYDRDAELAFKQWAVERLTKTPHPVQFADPDRDQFSLRAMWGLGAFTQGVVTSQELETYFRTDYEQMVSKRPLWHELGKALSDMEDAANDAKVIHADWTEKNKHTNWFIRWTAETLGSGSTDLPEENAFSESDNLRQRCIELLGQHKLEALAPLIEVTAQKLYKVINDVEAYDRRVTSGAQTAIKWAERLKTAGSIAAGIASGGFGLTGSALVAGGYQFTQGAAEQLSAVDHGLQDNVDWAGLTTSAGVTTLLAVAGGALQSRFASAWEPKLASFGPDLSKRIASMAAAGTSSFYTTGAELVINHFATGAPIPDNVDDLADMIIDSALKNAGMDVALHSANERARNEYESWKAKRAAESGPPLEPGMTAEKPTPDAAKATGHGPAGEPGAGGPATEPAPKRTAADVSPREMPEAAVRSLLKSGGGWEQLHADLAGGTGVGHGMTVTERRELIRRFESHRQAIAREAAAAFDGQVEAAPGGGNLEIRLTGEGAADRAAQAEAYLDARHPGWAKENGLAVEAAPAPQQIENPTAVKEQKALDRELSPEVRALGSAMGRRFHDLPPTQAGRFEVLLAIVNDAVVASGAPPIRVEPSGRGPHFDSVNWRIEVPADFGAGAKLTPKQYAEMCNTFAHEARHARQMFEAARTASGPEATRMAVDFRPDVLQSAQALGPAGNARVAGIDPASLEHADARSYYDSLWGSGATDRRALLENGGTLEQSRVAAGEALAKERQAADKMYKLRNAPQRSLEVRLARRALEMATEGRVAAEQQRQAKYDQYRNLAEEIDAWAHGDAVQAAVIHYTDLRAGLERAQFSEQNAYAHLAAVRDAYLRDPNAGPAAMQDYAQALTRWRTIASDVESRARKLAAVAVSKPRRQ